MKTSFPKLENRISSLENDVRTIKQNTEKAIELILKSTEQLGEAFETLSDQMEKIYSQRFQVDYQVTFYATDCYGLYTVMHSYMYSYRSIATFSTCDRA